MVERWINCDKCGLLVRLPWPRLVCDKCLREGKVYSISKRRWVLPFLLLIVLPSCARAQPFPLDPSLWLIDPSQADAGIVLPFTKRGALAFNFNRDTYTGYVLLPWTQPLQGTFTASLQVLTSPDSPDKPVRFVMPVGACESPGRVYLFFQTNELYNGIEGTQWWASFDGWTLAETGTATVILTADLGDSTRWTSVYGHPASNFPSEYANAKAHPTYVGLTLGGNCSNGHGVSPRKGDAQFRLVSMEIQ